ncbi:GPW/gp25 family protein [Sinobacterium caligoides]|nr:GPW/gp25 family protein [Sinobacterium caligoides]
MNNETGKVIDSVSHLKQSIIDIITTPIGSRVMRRDYGCGLFSLIDSPVNATLIAGIRTSVIEALDRYEPRVKVRKVEVNSIESGVISISLEALYLLENRMFTLEDLKVEQR